MTSGTASALPFPEGLAQSAYRDRAEWLASARFATSLLAEITGRPHLEGAQVLDVGCGTKVTKALIDDGWPVARYVGIDVSAEVIDWLEQQVDDERFAFHHLAARNELYSPEGPALVEIDALPTGGEPFDVICLFSVFTHLGPDDFSAMMRLLHPCLKSDGHLVFSIFLTDPTGAWAAAVDQALASPDPVVVQHALDGISRAMEKPGPRFVDEVPEMPLLRVRYDRDYATELVEQDGTWRIAHVAPPGPYIQNYMVCQPR